MTGIDPAPAKEAQSDIDLMNKITVPSFEVGGASLGAANLNNRGGV